ncbi:rho GTPase-activating protein 11A-like [Carcharodon carcharias]|uniref:rho GTPase-activating protein 11A-like n=1 Tax=Carcharodon carcharias TaxID=13397 RepID=UPI001B7F5016|nr:rho GTPase-activating protein 11A-like [Carcharodon carcharias]
MKADRNVLRLAAVQQLRAYGIKVKNWSRINNDRVQGRDKKITSSEVFGTPLHALPQCTVLEHTTVPQFLVDACVYLGKHIHTEGLFRKSGSVIRLKALKAKVDQGEKCITMAPPCDVAGLVKQFFRELPEPLLPAELHEAFFKAQQLQNDDSITATILLSCLLPERTADTLRYFLNFLKNVSLRSEDNKMDASNLAVVIAPNLFHSGEGSEKITALTEKQLHLQAATVHTLIDNFEHIGRVPEFILEKIPAMIGVCVESSSPSLEHLEGGDGSTLEGSKRRRRRSVGDIVSGALSKFKANRTPSATPQPDTSGTSSGTPIIMTPTWKRKILADSSQSLGFSNKKRRSLRHNIALELLPSGFLSQNSTPSSDGVKKDDVYYQAQCTFAEGSPQVSLESLQGPLSLSAGSVKFQSTASVNRRKSKRLENKGVERMESGKASCFSPKLNRKGTVRKSLRLRFGLGKNRDPNTLSSGGPAPNGSENIGWRLANQRDVHNYSWFSAEDLPFTPVVRHTGKKDSKRISKSEENLLTPACNKDTHRMSWNGASPTEPQVICSHPDLETPLECYLNSRSYQSEPALVIRKPPTIPGDFRKQCAAHKNGSRNSSDSLSEDANIGTGETMLKIKRAFSESRSNTCSIIEDHKPPTVNNLCKSDLLLQQTQNVVAPQKPDSSLGDPSDQKCSCSELSSLQVSEIKHQNAKIDSCSTDINTTQGMSSNLNCISNLHQQDVNGAAVLQDKKFLPLDDDHSNLNKAQKSFKCVTVFSFTEQPYPDQVPSNYKELKGQEENSKPVENLTAPNSAGTSDDHHPSELHQPMFLPNELEPTLNKRDDNLLSTDGTPALEFPSKMLPLDVPLRKVSEEIVKKTECGHHKVVEHIQWFNSLSLNDQNPKCKTVKSPLKFKRTPVRQSIKRMNSLLYGNDKSIATRTRSCTIAVGSPMVKSISHKSTLSFNLNSFSFTQNEDVKQSKHRSDVRQNNLPVEGFRKTKPAAQIQHSAVFKQEHLVSQQKNSFDQNINQSVFEDLTNGKMPRIHQVDCVLPEQNVIIEKMSCVTPEKSICNSMLHKVSEKEKHRYKGSPKCPISSAKLTAKAIDL